MDEKLVRKLLLKPGMRAVVLNSPHDSLDRLMPLPEGAKLVEKGPADWVQAFMRNKAEVDLLAPEAIAIVKRDGVLWLCYPKGGSKVGTDINRDSGWGVVVDAGWGPVTQVAVDEQWSALRFRREADVRRKGEPPQQKDVAR